MTAAWIQHSDIAKLLASFGSGFCILFVFIAFVFIARPPLLLVPRLGVVLSGRMLIAKGRSVAPRGV